MPQGVITEYDKTAGLPRDFDPVIYMLSREYDLVLQGGGVSADGRTVLSRGSADQKKVEWEDEELLLPRTTLGASVDNSASTISVASSNDRLKFQTGDVLKIESEKVLVTGYNATASVLEVTRGFQSTSAASHASAVKIKGLGAALAEGSDPQEIRSLDGTDRYNLTQIFGLVEVRVSGTRQATRRFGVPAGAEFNREAAKRLIEQMVHFEQALIHGTRWEDTSAKKRTMGGLDYYITDNTNSGSAITYANARTLSQAIYEDGGNPDRLLIPVTQKTNVDDIDADDIRLVRTDGGRGQIVEQLVSSFAVLDVVMSREIEDTHAFMFSRDQAEVKTLRPWQFVPLAKTGDAVRGMWVGEKTLEFQGDRHAGKYDSLG
jgi:hypothetical protein